jgi:ATP-dependent helicase/nuclease subunit B
MRRLNLHSIPPGVPFLETLVDALLDGALIEGYAPRGDPMALAAATLYLPTRRSARAIRTVFLDRLGGEGALLPRLRALGEVDEDEAAFDAGTLDPLPDPVSPIDRQIGLTRLILGWSGRLKRALLPIEGEEEALMIPSSPGDAAGLARELARFIDGMQGDRVPAEAIGRLKAEHEGLYDRYWDLTVTFLAIATEAWPRHLLEIGRIDPVERRNRLLEAEAERIALGRSAGPVIVAGATGSVPATRDLIAAVAASRHGAAVLPGLDLGLDEAGWRAIGVDEGAPGHPQATLKALLASLGTERDLVAPLGEAPPGPPGPRPPRLGGAASGLHHGSLARWRPPGCRPHRRGAGRGRGGRGGP